MRHCITGLFNSDIFIDIYYNSKFAKSGQEVNVHKKQFTHNDNKIKKEELHVQVQANFELNICIVVTDDFINALNLIKSFLSLQVRRVSLLNILL